MSNAYSSRPAGIVGVTSAAAPRRLPAGPSRQRRNASPRSIEVIAANSPACGRSNSARTSRGSAERSITTGRSAVSAGAGLAVGGAARATATASPTTARDPIYRSNAPEREKSRRRSAGRGELALATLEPDVAPAPEGDVPEHGERVGVRAAVEPRRASVGQLDLDRRAARPVDLQVHLVPARLDGEDLALALPDLADLLAVDQDLVGAGAVDPAARLAVDLDARRHQPVAALRWSSSAATASARRAAPSSPARRASAAPPRRAPAARRR